MNRKGQFSIIAALLVAVVLIGTVMVTYSALTYSSSQEPPQILNAVNETNLGLKEILAFTVGYYGSILKVTGNMSYAQELATSYLDSGLTNIGSIRPEWGGCFQLENLTLKADWFSNHSYSQGTINVNYNLTGLGISGISYSTSCRLDVQIANSGSPNQAKLTILRDNDEPLINLGRNNLKFYCYDYQASNWTLTQPTNIASYADGTYVIDLPPGLLGDSYVIQVEDTRGIMVVASSFTQFTSTLTWNSSYFQTGLDFVDNSSVITGIESNFNAQQNQPDGIYDTLTEALSGTFNVDTYPTGWTPLGSTSLVSGGLTDLQSDNGVYMQLHSYPTSYSSSYNTIGFDNQNSAVLQNQANSLSWTHTTGTGSDRLLLVSIDVFPNSGTPTTVSSITYDGTALTQLATDYYSSNPRVRSYVYYLLNPSIGTKTINVNFVSSTYAVGGSVTYTNVNQTTPFLASNTATGSGTSQSVTLTATGSSSKVLFGHLGTYRTSNPPPYTVTDGQTTRWSQTTQQYKGFGSEKTVTNGTVGTSWSTSNTVNWVAITALLQPTQVGTAFACAAEFTGTANTDPLNNIVWSLNAGATNSGVSVTYQLYNYRTGQYTTVGDGYLTDTLGPTDSSKSQTITSSLTDYRDSSGNWKIRVNATQATTTQFDLKLDLIRYTVNENNYALNIQEQWLNVNATNLHQELCIKTGTMDNSEPLLVQVLHDGSWQNLMTLAPNWFNNASLAQYIDSTTLTIRFVGSNDITDPIQSSWNIDSVYIKDVPDINYLVNLDQPTFTVEVLQNGTMRWLGQDMRSTTQTLAIPPVPVKAIHVNETINGVNQEVPFQIEDWASNYQIPLGLTSNTTVFSNRQMIVFLLNSAVSDFTIWWDGNDNATQTPLSYTDTYFTNDNPTASTLTNGNVTLFFDSNFNVKATVGSTSSTASFMRINQDSSSYGSAAAFVIYHGVVRDIVQQEAEWSGGANGCPNLYANIIISLPANTTYYTYQLRIMFINSAQTRTITDLSPIQLTTTATSTQLQTENDTFAGFPILQNGTATFTNYTIGGWTPHHFSQFISDSGKGAGIMFSDSANQKLYAFDSFSGSTAKGGLKTSNSSIELLPVSSGQVQFTFAYDINWRGAVATFDGTTPVCDLYDGTTPMGLWILVEYPPSLTETASC